MVGGRLVGLGWHGATRRKAKMLTEFGAGHRHAGGLMKHRQNCL
jgi:hypothetical protein